MSHAAPLLSELLAARKRPQWAPLTWFEQKLERAGHHAFRAVVATIAAFLVVAFVAFWFRPLGDSGKQGIFLLFLVNVFVGYIFLVINAVQVAAMFYVPNVRRAHGLHRFAHQRALAVRVAEFSITEVNEAELWLKQQAKRIRVVGAVVGGGPLTLATVVTLFQNTNFQSAVQAVADVVGSVFHVSVATAKVALEVGTFAAICQLGFSLLIAARYDWLTGVIEHSRLIRPALPAN
ncbi:hypothetical protein [Dyella sp. 333MFSha]|uniref:hypothetical protein n=1 Tax=Dyella sp. 333MFSha TaxID=1798240 RepID=UPI000886EE9B|nr:hypothetical protein [Dyella sp. 333MFSha]SDF26761.1 hypothetical protein SAMN04515659_0544 [Dyella sp. 333MFSha]